MPLKIYAQHLEFKEVLNETDAQLKLYLLYLLNKNHNLIILINLIIDLLEEVKKK